MMATAGSGWTTRQELRLSRIGRRPFMETILLVDDEADVLATDREMLEEQGYDVFHAFSQATIAGPNRQRPEAYKRSLEKRQLEQDARLLGIRTSTMVYK